MKEESLEITGKTVEDAIEIATLELGVGRDEVAVDVVSHGRSGILGIGSEPAKVRVRRIDGGGVAAAALAMVSRLLDELSVNARASIRAVGTGPDMPSIIDIQGEDAGLLIGNRGDTLRALQFILNTMLARRTEDGEPVTPVVVDIEHYRRRREQNLQRLAVRMARRATETGRVIDLEPMNPADRRIIHIALAESTAVTTESSGEGLGRHVEIKPIDDGSLRRSGSGRRGSYRQH